jgi:DNA-binding sugar fermentation-stimulating protein
MLIFFMKIPGKKIEAEFEARVNRFVARVRLQKKKPRSPCSQQRQAGRTSCARSPRDFAGSCKLIDALRRAARAGVDIFAFRCAVEPEEIKLIGPVDVRL